MFRRLDLNFSSLSLIAHSLYDSLRPLLHDSFCPTSLSVWSNHLIKILFINHTPLYAQMWYFFFLENNFFFRCEDYIREDFIIQYNYANPEPTNIKYKRNPQYMIRLWKCYVADKIVIIISIHNIFQWVSNLWRVECAQKFFTSKLPIFFFHWKYTSRSWWFSRVFLIKLLLCQRSKWQINFVSGTN